MHHKTLSQAVRSELRWEYIKEIAIWFIICGTIAGMFYFLFVFSVARVESKECAMWQKWQTEYPGFVVSPIMKEQCVHYNISL